MIGWLVCLARGHLWPEPADGARCRRCPVRYNRVRHCRTWSRS